MYRSLLLLVFSLASLFSVETPIENGIFPCFHLLDQQDNIFLCRGNFPALQSDFAQNFELIVISFLNFFTEEKMIFREQKWFDTHIEQGNLYIYPLYGTLVNPINTPIAIRDCILHCFDIDGLKTLMFQLKRIMETKSEKDRIIYIHCAAGKDRTGEASACYLMEYKQYSYKEAVQLNEKIAGRSIEASNMNAIRWYAFYLRDVKHAFWIGDIEGY